MRFSEPEWCRDAGIDFETSKASRTARLHVSFGTRLTWLDARVAGLECGEVERGDVVDGEVEVLLSAAGLTQAPGVGVGTVGGGQEGDAVGLRRTRMSRIQRGCCKQRNMGAYMGEHVWQERTHKAHDDQQSA